MKALLEAELEGATYYVDLTAKDAIFYADPGTVQAVIDSLETTFQTLTSGGDSSATDPRFPEHSFPSEPPSYGPLSNLLNKIIYTASRHMPRSLLTELRFQHFGDEMKDKYGSFKGLKPDGVGTIGELSTGTEEPAEVPAKGPAKKPVLSWEQVEATFESKSTIMDMVRQSATYARCCLISNQRRFFSLGIGFHFKKLEAYVFLFHRAGLSSSYPLKVTTRDGFDGLVRHIVGILSLKDKAAYGLDTTRTDDMFRINNRYYKVVRILYSRGSLRGRSTFVYSLQAMEDTPPQELESRMLTLSVDHLPDKITYKQTYQIKGSSHEGPLLSQFNGQFGIADVIGYYECGPEDPRGTTRSFSKNAEFWNVFGKQDLPEGGRHEPEERELQCIALSGEGKALIDLDNPDGGTPSPGELLESILHAIIGHYNLFDKGVLHRDISSGNVLRHSVPVRRPALDK
ncbi:hypothetical protein F5888DRAFT_1078011 [Russula emetica]|nr:hypothetical protein F5888DRAFT_1078011 [Russula emetica]